MRPAAAATVLAPVAYFAQIAARRQWDAEAVDLTVDAAAWPALDGPRRARLRALLAGFCVAEGAVAEHLDPYAGAAHDPATARVFELQRRDEQRHAAFFDRIAAEVLVLPGATAAERRRAARAEVGPAFLELFEDDLPRTAADLAAGRTDLGHAVGLYHLLLEGVVFDAGQRALLDELADGALPGLREGTERVALDERWHIGFGLRCLAELAPAADRVVALADRAEVAAAAWGTAVPDAIRREVVHRFARRLAAAGLSASAAAA